MLETLRPILEWINLHPELSGLATFIISALESIAIIGTIIPGTVMMTAIGTLAGAGVIPLWPTILWAILGAIVGDGISYWVGHAYKDRLHLIWPFRKYPTLLKRGEDFFHKHGVMSVFIGRFVGPVRALVPLVAGMLSMSPLRFTIANVLSAIGWAPIYMLPGILLGALSLELPPDIAIHAVLVFLAVILLFFLFLWMLKKITQLIGHQIDHLLTASWNRLKKSRYFHIVTWLLKHHDPKKTHGQLTLAFYFVIVTVALFYLTSYIMLAGSPNIYINNLFLHFFRSIRTPHLDTVMIAITFLGEKMVLLPLTVTLFLWLAYKKNWHTAWHVLGLGVLTAVGVKSIKWIAHSARPWGILESPESYSFPSGHTTLTVVFYMGISLLLIKAWQIRSRGFMYWLAGIIIFAISVSRLYLGVHWFTDVVGGWLLGSAILMFIVLSYNRKPEHHTLAPKGIVLTILITLFFSYSTSLALNFTKTKHNLTQLDWPVQTISPADWWNFRGKHLPLYRINRFGMRREVLNLQWIGNLSAINASLLRNGWENPPESDWANVIFRIVDIQSTEHLPLFSLLHLDKNPALVLTKSVNGDKKLIILRLWDSHVQIQGGQPLWVGNVAVIPSTYSWLFKHKKKNDFILTPDILFLTDAQHYKIKTFDFTPHGHTEKQPIILIKPN